MATSCYKESKVSNYILRKFSRKICKHAAAQVSHANWLPALCDVMNGRVHANNTRLRTCQLQQYVMLPCIKAKMMYC